MSDKTESILRLATAYARDIANAERSAVAGEPEAKLTVPVSNLFSGLVTTAGLGRLDLIRETRLDRTRPDFAALHTIGGRTHQKGYIELKATGFTVDVSKWKGRNATQWGRMKDEAEILIVCNGAEAQLYHHGIAKGAAVNLPLEHPEQWDPVPLVGMLGRFLELRPLPVTKVTDLSQRLAVRTADLRDRILWLLDQDGDAATAANGGLGAWRRHVYPEASARDFADGVSQVVAYGMVLAVLTADDADRDGDGYVSVDEARAAIRPISPVLAAAFAPLVDKPVLFDAVQVELGALETLVSAIDAAKVNAHADRRGDRWLSFYEDFLAIYDPEERRQAGVYFTPVPVVKAMTAMTGKLLTDRLGKRLGFADPNVVTLDPATGTGTFLLAVIDHATQQAIKGRGEAGGVQAAVNLGRNLFGFELLPGPYSVAHLRLGQSLRKLSKGAVSDAHVLLTDTLELQPEIADAPELWGDAETLAAEQARARKVKLDSRVTVVIGNPPYRRVERDLRGRGSGGWIIDGEVPDRLVKEQSLFDDILDVAKANTIFSHHASLYNLYVYFWRWAIWKAFEAHGDGPGVVSFITGSSWLHGPGFVGLRQLVREICDECWVIDLGGDNKGANPEENIFAIETPVAVVTMVRDNVSDRSSPASIHYRRVRGTAEDKLAAMQKIADGPDAFAGDWLTAPAGWLDPMMPSTGDAAWEEMPLITDLFPWQQPGCKFGRTWPIAPSEQLLKDRWRKFSEAPAADRPGLFVTATSGRNTKTKVAGLPLLAEARANDPHQPIARYGYRSFDRQWAFDDPRMAKTDSPSLWQSRSSKQLFLTSLLTKSLGVGPALTATSDIPDLDYFSGRGGKDIIPLWRNEAASIPNLPQGLSRLVGKRLGIEPPSVGDMAAYVYALLSATAYQARFEIALRTPGLRVPLTANRAFWIEAVTAGSELLWLHTYAERFGDAGAGRGKYVSDLDGIGWTRTVSQIPASTSDIVFDREAGTLTIGNGILVGVRPEVWDYKVSGMPVVGKWLGYRTAKGTGRAASSGSGLDHIRPTEWADEWNDELLDLIRILTLTVDRQDALADLLERICAGSLIPASALPVPTSAERQPPPTLPRKATG